MLRWLCFLTATGVVSGFALLLVTGRYAADGPVVVAVSPDHGIHAGDVFVVAGWAVAMLALSWMAVDPGPRAGRRAASSGLRRQAPDPHGGPLDED